MEGSIEIHHPFGILFIDKISPAPDTLDFTFYIPGHAGELSVGLPDYQSLIKGNYSRTGIFKERGVVESDLFKVLLSLKPPESLTDFVIEFGKLRFWIPAFPDVIRCAVVNGFNDDFLPPPAGEEDERRGAVSFLKDL